MSGAFYSDLSPHGNKEWFGEHLGIIIKPLKAVFGVFILTLVIIYFSYLLSLIACSILSSLGIIKSSLCSVILG